jgi:hypothetical protein
MREIMSSVTARFLPKPRIHEVHHLAVATDPVQTWFTLRSFDLYRLRYVHALFALRGLRGKTATLDEIVAPGQGFQCLAEDEGRYFVAGAIGRFWERRGAFVDVAPEDFATFAAPGFGKVVWSLEVHPREDGGSWIVIDLRIDATTDEAWNGFLPYWIGMGRFYRSIRRHLLGHFERMLGRARPDTERALPGDQLLVVPRVNITDAITIEAPVDEVWAHVLERRGLWRHASASDRLAVIDMELHRALVLGSPSLLADEAEAEPSDYVVTWTFYLEPICADVTRLILRVRADFTPTTLHEIGRPFFLAAHAVIESVQLWQLKTRAEAIRTE